MPSLVGYEYSVPNPSITQAQVNQLFTQIQQGGPGLGAFDPTSSIYNAGNPAPSGKTSGIFADYTSAYSFLNALGQSSGLIDPFHQTGGQPTPLTPQSFLKSYIGAQAGVSTNIPLGAEAQQNLQSFPFSFKPVNLHPVLGTAPAQSDVLSGNLYKFAVANKLQTGVPGNSWFGNPANYLNTQELSPGVYGPPGSEATTASRYTFDPKTGLPSLQAGFPNLPPIPPLPDLGGGTAGTGGLPPGSTVDPVTGQITLPAGSTIPLSLDPLLQQYFSALNSNLSNFSSQLNAFGGSIHDQLLSSFPELGQLSQFLTSSFQSPVPQDLLSSFTESLRNAQIARGFDAGAGPSLAEATAVTNLAEQRRLNLVPALQQLGTSLVGMSGLAGPADLSLSVFGGLKNQQTSQQLQYMQQQQQAQQFQQTQALAQSQFKLQQKSYEDSLKASKEQSQFALNEYRTQQAKLDEYMRVQKQIADAPRQRQIAQLTASSVATSQSQANLPGWVQGIEDTYGVTNAISSAISGQNAYRDYLINHPYMI